MNTITCENCYRSFENTEIIRKISGELGKICKTCYEIKSGDGKIFSTEEILDWQDGYEERKANYVKLLEQTDLLKEYVNKFPTVTLEIDINKIFPNKWNPNLQTDFMFKKEMESIKTFGFVQPILVRQIIKGINEYEIVDGEHRWKACKELGFTKIKAENFGELTEAQAKTLTIIMNRLRGNDDILKRAQLEKELKESQPSLLESLPFQANEIDEELKLLDFDFSIFDKPINRESEKNKDLEGALKKSIELEIILRRIKEVTKNDKLRLAIEQFIIFNKMLKSYLN